MHHFSLFSYNLSTLTLQLLHSVENQPINQTLINETLPPGNIRMKLTPIAKLISRKHQRILRNRLQVGAIRPRKK